MKKDLNWRLIILVLVLPVALGVMVNCTEEGSAGSGPGSDGYTDVPDELMGTWQLFGLIDVQTGNASDATIIGISINLRMEEDTCRYTSYVNLDVEDTGIIRWRTEDNVEYMEIESDSVESDTTLEFLEMEVVDYDNNLINMVGLFEGELDEELMMHWLMAKGPGIYGMVAESGILSPPVENATVTLENNDVEVASVITDEYGVYSFTDTDPVMYTVDVSSANHEPQATFIMADETDPTMYNFFLTPVDGGGSYSTPPAIIMGTWHLFGLIDVQSQSAFDAVGSGMSVHLEMEGDVCRYTSYVNLEVDDTGTIRWRTQNDIEYMEIESDSVATDTTMEILLLEVVSYDSHLFNMIGEFEEELDDGVLMHWLMAKGPGIYGMVAESGILTPPIEDALIILEDSDQEFASVNTDEYGVYSFPDIEPGEYTVLTSDDDYEQQSQLLVSSETDPTMYNFFLTPVDDGGGGDPIGTVYGTVTDYDTALPVAGALIYSETGQNTQTDNNGEYSFLVNSGNRQFVVSAMGYQTYVTTVDVIAETSTQADFVLTQGTTGTGTIEGMVTDSQTGYGLENVLVQVGGLSVYTDSFGEYTLTDIDAGYNVVSVTLEGYYPQTNEIIVPEGETVVLNFTMSPELLGSELRFVLSWGAEPRDLDSHLKTPEIEGSFYHVYFGNSGIQEYPPYATLDTDDTDGFGPETITLYDVFTGTYHYYIHKWSGVGDLAGCGAIVRVYDETGQIYELTAPQPQAGEEGYEYWDVLQIVNESIILTNDIVELEPGPEYLNIDEQTAKRLK